MSHAEFDADVLVVGAGPSGLCLANLLGTYGISTLVVEREHEGYAYPRAVGIDDESVRTCQAVGLAERVLDDALENMPIRYYASSGRCFAHVKPSAKPFGWARRNLFLQPILEATLRDGLERFDRVELRHETTLVSYEQDASGVSALLEDAGGTQRPLRTRFLVGTDGGRSTVRGLSGIQLTGRTAADRWLVVDVEHDALDAPYSAVYCHPRHPVLMVPLPYGHRRFEFKVAAGDVEKEVTQPDRILARLAPRYGDTPLPTILRARVYTHHSRIAERFQDDRVFLAGDAAHLQPPFFGQGMNSGIRDVTNLAWKLAAVVTERAPIDLLDTYDRERREHAGAMVDFATRMGRFYTPYSRLTEGFRELSFSLLQRIPGAKEYILQMKYKPMPRYERGFVAACGSNDASTPGRKVGVSRKVGTLFMQPLVESAGGDRQLLDETLGAWFCVLGVGIDPAEWMSEDSKRWWQDLGARFLHVAPPKSAIRASDLSETVVVEDVDGAFRDLHLESPQEELIVLRPDRYVAAVCDRHEIDATTDALRELIPEAGPGVGEPSRWKETRHG